MINTKIENVPRLNENDDKSFIETVHISSVPQLKEF